MNVNRCRRTPNNEAGLIATELVTTLIILGIVISASYTVLTIQRAIKLNLKNQNNIVQISSCIPSETDKCLEIKKRQFTSLHSCQKQIMGFKSYCSYFKERSLR